MKKIEALCATCNLGRIKGTIQQVSGGLLHTMYHVCTEQGEYAIKWLNPDIMKRPDAMQNMINSEQIAHKFSDVVPLITAKSFGGQHVIESGGDYYLIYDWLEGRSIFVPEITEYHCTQIGRILGQIHSDAKYRSQGDVRLGCLFESCGKSAGRVLSYLKAELRQD